MIISDLNHLETISESQNIEGGVDFNFASPTTQTNLAIVGQFAGSTAIGLFAAESTASNDADVDQTNLEF